MALVTVQRSPSPSTDPDLGAVDSFEDASDGRSQLRKRSKTSKEKLRKIFSSVRFLSKFRPRDSQLVMCVTKLHKYVLSESYFTIKGAALILPHTECTKKSTKKSHGGEIQSHLQAMLHLLRPEDSIKIAVRLEDTCHSHRYMALVSTRGRQDTEEAVILGIDCSSTTASIGLVLPMWMGLKIKLGGDGGFSLRTDEQSYLFKPTSVQAMWSATQSLYKVLRIAEDMKYIPDGLTHTWIGYYRSRIDNRDSARMCQWNVEGVEVFAPSSLSIKSNDSDTDRIKLAISHTLKEVMMTVDLDEATSVMLRTAVEEKLHTSLTEFKSYFDEEVMRIVGQMDKPSEILEFLYLGSEWNASNLEELLEIGIGYILNVTKEIDNFFEGRFQYHNVRVYDVDESDLLRHWKDTYKFISKARSHKSKVLVHCKMGVSRSASTVMAFIMKDERKTVDEAFQFVKERRSCVHPNSGFMEQLRTYEGILSASNKRDIFRCKSEQSVQEEGTKMEAEPSPGFFLEDSVFNVLPHSDWHFAPGAVGNEEECVGSLHKDEMYNLGIMHMETDLEAAESRSADSTEDVLPDQPSPTPETATVACVLQAPSPSSAAVAAPPTPCIARLSGALASDVEVTHHEQEANSQVELYTVWSSEGSGSLVHQASISASGSRIKPDRSWIRLDTMGLEGDSCSSIIPFTDNSSSTAQTNPCPSSASKTVGTIESQSEELKITASNIGEPRLALTATNVPKSLPFFSPPAARAGSLSPDKSASADMRVGVDFYLGSIQNPVDIKSAATVNSDITQRQLNLSQQLSLLSSSELCSSQRKSPDEAPASAVSSSSLPNMQGNTVKQAPMEQTEILTENLSECKDLILNRGEGDPKVEEGDAIASSTSMRNPQNKIEPGVRQYFFREKIPWKPGKVRKMQEDINKTGQISLEEDTDNDGRMMETNRNTAFFQENDEHSLLEHTSELQPALTLCQSHSCMELCTPCEDDPAPMSVYEKEEIPLTPGTVLRTRLEIEERQRLFCGDGDQEVFSSFRPVLRTSSLRQERGTPYSKYADSRRLTCGPVMSPLTGRSLDNLQSVRPLSLSYLGSASSVQMGDNVRKHMAVDECSYFLHKARLFEPQVGAGVVRKHKMELESKYEIDKIQSQIITRPDSPCTSHPSVASSPTSQSLHAQDIQSSSRIDRVPAIGDTDIKQQPGSPSAYRSSREQLEPRGNLDFETLALIREIGSALLMSPNPPESKDVENDEPCANMVKYFVRKIEKQMVVSNPARNIVVMDTAAWKASSPDKDDLAKEKCPSVSGNSNVNCMSQTFQTPTRPTKPDLISLTNQSSRGACTDLSNDQAEARQDITHAAGIQKCSLKSVERDRNDSARTSSSLKTDSQISLLLPMLSQTLEENQRISHPTSAGLVQEQVAAGAVTGSVPSCSSCSPGQGLENESPEPSVVRHLVGRFENRTPESERFSSELGHDCTHSNRDSRDMSVPAPSASLRAQREEQAHLPWCIENSTRHFASSSSQSLTRPAHNPSQPVSSLGICTNPETSFSVSVTSSIASPILSLHRKHVSLDSTQDLPTVNKRLPLTCDIAIELNEFSSKSLTHDVREPASSSFPTARKLGPVPFTRSYIDESLEKKTWRSVRPESADHVQRSASYSEHDSTSSDILQSRNSEESYSNLTELDDDISLRQISDEGRKIRRLQGRSHPLTKLTEYNLGKGPFYSSM